MSKADARADKKGGEKRGIKRDRSTQKRLKLYSSRPIRDKGGQIVYQAYQSKDKSHQARVEPNRKWFGPVRTVTQTELNTFREELKNQQNQPYQYLLRSSKVPYSLLRDSQKEGKANLLEVESFDSTFGKKSTRKRPRLSSYSLNDLASEIEKKEEKYSSADDVNLPKPEAYKEAASDVYFKTGQSNRIWNELFKVVDSSDVIVQVIDARDPVGTRCGYVEAHIKKNCPHKHLVLVMNKCDLIPTWAAKRWLHELGKEYPTLAFHASLTKSFGKGALITLLRQFQNIHKDQPQISVGFIGYPNVGKSSVINTLRQKNVCKTAPIPGETKVWQYITLYKKIFLIDCPGVVTPGKDETEADVVLKGVLRVENIPDPSQYIPELMKRVKPEHLQKTYEIYDYDDAEDFLEKFAYKSGKLLKKGEPDMETSAKMILNDWIRGKIPYFTEPPNLDFPMDEEKLEFADGLESLENLTEEKDVEGDEALGEDESEGEGDEGDSDEEEGDESDDDKDIETD